MANTILNFHFDYWNTSLSWLHDIYRNQVEISVSLFSGALCLSQCQGRCSLLLPPRVSHEISWPQVRLHHVCQVLSSMKKSWITSWSSICLVNHIVLHFLWHFASSGRFINQACACTVGFLRCWSLDGSEEITETWCSIGKKGLEQIWGTMCDLEGMRS